MRGLELSRAYFEEYGRPMLEGEFAELLPVLGLTTTSRATTTSSPASCCCFLARTW